MEFLKDEKERLNTTRLITIICMLLILIIVSSYLGLTYYRPFHIVVEVFNSFIAFSILIMAVNTYELSKNIPFLFIGVAYGVSGGFNVIHIIASNGVGFFQGDTTNLSMTFSLIQRYITAISILICCRLFYKSYKIITPITIVLSFSVISALLLLWIFLWGKFPNCYIENYGSTSFKIASEYIISAIGIICGIIFFNKKEYIESNAFFILQFYLCCTIICNILLTFYTVQQEITNVLAHILKVISFYCVYRAIVKVGLKTPYKLLFNELNQKNNSLKLKDSELEQAVRELQQESELRKNMEEMFLKNEACYKLLIENSKDTIIIYNEEKIVFANDGAAHLIGVENPEKLLGKAVTEFFELNTIHMFQEMIEKKCEENTIAPAYETQLKGIDGRTIHVEVTNACVTHYNKAAILSLIRDISTDKQIEKMKMDVEEDRKLLNETLETNRLITEFFSNISHELRTPLNVILSALQVLALEKHKDALGEAAEKRSKYIKIMRQNCYRLLRLINNLIDISKIDAGYSMLNLQNHNIVSVVEEVTLSVAEYVENKGVRLIFDTNIEEKIIDCDPDKIERIMLNLISNAVKFTDEGDQITVEILYEENNIKISVKDTGVGIPEDKLQIIFERFRQVDNSQSKNRQGSGIGLSLVKALVELHGGNINVKSKIGEGSEFIINLPARKIENSEVIKNNIIREDSRDGICIEFSDIS